MLNPLQLIPAAFGLVNWRAHRRQDAAHRRQDDAHEQLQASVDMLRAEIHQPPPAFPPRGPHYAATDAIQTAPRSRGPWWGKATVERGLDSAPIVIMGREFRDSDEVAESLSNYEEPADVARKIAAQTETGRWRPS